MSTSSLRSIMSADFTGSTFEVVGPGTVCMGDTYRMLDPGNKWSVADAATVSAVFSTDDRLGMVFRDGAPQLTFMSVAVTDIPIMDYPARSMIINIKLSHEVFDVLMRYDFKAAEPSRFWPLPRWPMRATSYDKLGEHFDMFGDHREPGMLLHNATVELDPLYNRLRVRCDIYRVAKDEEKILKFIEEHK